MPMMAAYEHNDARDTARILACRTLEGLKDLDRAPRFENAINNMYRLLQGFRSHGFYGYVDDRSSAADEVSPGSMTGLADRNVGDLRGALEGAFKDAFGAGETAHAVDRMRLVLRSVAYPGDQEAVDPADVLQTTRFFEVLVSNLAE